MDIAIGISKGLANSVVVAKVAKLATERATSIGEVEGEARSCV